MQRQSFGSVGVGSLMQMPPAFWSQPCMLQFSGLVQSQGCTVGAAVGATDGEPLGEALGAHVGLRVGATVGLPVGLVVSVQVCPVCLSKS